MAVGSFLKTSGLAALAAGLAMLALPAAANAQDWGGQHRGNRGDGGSWSGGNNGGGGGWRGSEGGGRRGDGGGTQTVAPSPPPAPAQTQSWNSGGQDVPQVRTEAPRREWSGGGGGWRGRSGGEGGGWRGRNGGEGGGWQRGAGNVPTPAPQWNGGAPVIPQQQAEVQRHGWQGGDRNWSGGNSGRAGRNQTYTDPNRNTTYRDVSREQHGTRNEGWRGDRRGDDRRWEGNRRQGDSGWRGNNNWNQNRGWRDSNRGGYNTDHRRWSRDWRHDNRYNWHSYRNTNRDIYRMGQYYSPYRGYSYRRLGIGFFLDSLFYSSQYWINDPWNYRLPEAYGPYRWVRYYDDALLVDIYTGEVVDVITDFFW